MLVPRCLSAIAIALSLARALSGAAMGGPPNVLLVSIDSLRRDHVGAYGYGRATTPTIDRLGREGVIFRQAVSPSSWTLPAHMTLLTSLPPRQHGLTKVQFKLTRELHPLPRVFRDQGYATAGFVSGPLLSSEFGFAEGFDLYDDWSVPQTAYAKSERGATAPLVVKLAIDWLEGWRAAPERKSFFLFLHLWDVHYDYSPPPPYDRMFDPEYDGTLSAESFRRNPDIHPGMAERDLAHVLALYDGEIRFTDDQLGRLLDHLARLGVLDDTIVAVTADHGDEFFEHGRKGHGLTVYDELILVPLVLRSPGRIPPGQVVSPQVRLADLGPTLLGLAGVEPPQDFGTGERWGPEHRERDLSRWITGAEPIGSFPELVAIAESQLVYGFGTGAVRTPESKLIEFNAAGRASELYELASDPHETRNRASADGKEVARLSRVRATWSSALGDWQAPVGRRHIPKDAHESLRALGYVE